MKIIKKTYFYFFIINFFAWIRKPSNDYASLNWMVSKIMFNEYLKNTQ